MRYPLNSRKRPARSVQTIALTLCLFRLALPVHAQIPAANPGWGLPALMANLRQVRSSTAGFVETRHLRLLDQAQRSSGQLIYVAPSYLRKETVNPVPSRLTVNGDRLTIEQPGNRPKEISLRDYSDIGALVESIRATLAGDLPSLTRYFAVTLDGRPAGWILTLTPLDAKLRDMVASIRISGEGAAIREVDTAEADGDRTEMAVTPESK